MSSNLRHTATAATARSGPSPASRPDPRLLAQFGGLGGGVNGARRLLALQRLAGNAAVQRAITVARQVDGGSCSAGPDLHCTAKVSRKHTRPITVSKPKKVKAPDGSITYAATGTLKGSFTASVTISLAKVPSGLSKCASGKMKTLIATQLKPHEEEHKRRFMTTDPAHSYVGKMNQSLTDTDSDPAALQSSILQRLRDSFDAELAARVARNQQYAVDAIDPFVVTADISDCPECQPKDEAAP
ncbi:MAG: hypothetical protein KY458_14325 [Actinobacteria bacterium]|nr:hypothetical protein [Actinomycetota bacterium]